MRNMNKYLTRSTIKHLLKQLAPLVLNSGRNLSDMEELLKQALVECASEMLESQGNKITQSQLSLMSGVHRKDVKRLINNDSTSEEEKTTLSIRDKVISYWLGDERYLDKNKNPKALVLKATIEEQQAIDMTSLIEESCGKDVAARTVINELQRLEIIEEKEGAFKLLEDNLYKNISSDEKLQFFARNTGRHIQASVENILNSPSPHIERAVYHDNLTREQIDILRTLSENTLSDLLKDVNQKALDYKKQNTNNPEAKHQMHLGALYYSDNISSGNTVSYNAEPNTNEVDTKDENT